MIPAWCDLKLGKESIYPITYWRDHAAMTSAPPTPKCDVAPLIDTVLEWLEAMDTDAIAKLAESRPSLVKGFRPEKAPKTIVLSRLRVLLQGGEAIPADIAKIANRFTREFALLGFLSAKAMPFALDWFGHSLGQREACAALLLHPDSDCHALAQDRWATWSTTPPSSAEVDVASGVLEALCGSIVLAIEKQRAVAESGAPDAEQAEANSLHSLSAPEKCKLEELERDLKEARKEAKAARKRAEEIADLKERVEKRLRGQEAELKSANEALDATKRALRESEERHERAVAEAAQRLVDRRLAPWLTDVERLADEANAIEASNLLHRADFLLGQQAKRDRKFGIRSMIAARIEECRIAFAKVESAQIDSLRPLPELERLSQELRSEISRLEDKLAPPKENQLPDQQVRDQIVRARDFGELMSLRKHILMDGCSADSKLQEPAELQALIMQTALRLQAEARFVAEKDETSTGMSKHPALDFWQRLQGGDAIRLFVDGHNFLGLVRDSCPSRTAEWHGAQARQHLTERLRAFASAYPSLSVDLWFDSPSEAMESASSNLRVIFSGGLGKNRADDGILKSLAHARQISPVYLVTADWQEAKQAELAGARVFLPDELDHLLG